MEVKIPPYAPGEDPEVAHITAQHFPLITGFPLKYIVLLIFPMEHWVF
jgi:hypothetical protein